MKTKRNARGQFAGHKLSVGKLLKSAGGTEMLVGVGIGLAGSAVARMAYVQFGDMLPAPVKDIVGRVLPLIGGAAAGAGAYAVRKKTDNLTGAVVAGIALTAWDFLQEKFTKLAGVVSLPMYDGYRGYNGVLVQDNSGGMMNGLVVDEPRPGMAGLAAMSMGDSDDNSGIEGLMEMDVA